MSEGVNVMALRLAGSTVAGMLMLGLVGVTPVSASPVTTVTMSVSGCEGCTFIAHDGRTWAHAWRKVAVTAPVSAGETTLVIPRKLTRTTSLEVVHPAGLTVPGATAFVAFSWSKVGGYWSGGICWGKQKGAKAHLKIDVSEFRARPVPGAAKETFIRARLAKLPPKAQAGVNGSPGCPELAR